MNARYPNQVQLDADEIERFIRIRLAKYFGVLPTQIDTMSVTDIDDVLDVLWAEQEIARWSKRGG